MFLYTWWTKIKRWVLLALFLGWTGFVFYFAGRWWPRHPLLYRLIYGERWSINQKAK